MLFRSVNYFQNPELPPPTPLNVNKGDIKPPTIKDGDYREINGMHARIYKSLALNCRYRDKRAIIIIHEAFHAVDKVLYYDPKDMHALDLGYEHEHRFYGLTTKERLLNADTYECYAGSTVGIQFSPPIARK